MEDRIGLIREAARKHYTDLPYHNFGHAIQVIRNARVLIDRCRKYNILVDEEIVEVAILFHDAGYAEETDYESKEAYAADIAREELGKIRFGKIGGVEKCIMATHKDAVPESVEEKIVRAADLMGLAGDYKTFRENSEKLGKEWRQLTGTEPDINAWIRLVNYYFSQTIVLTPDFNTDGFHERFRENVERYLTEEIGE